MIKEKNASQVREKKAKVIKKYFKEKRKNKKIINTKEDKEEECAVKQS